MTTPTREPRLHEEVPAPFVLRRKGPDEFEISFRYRQDFEINFLTITLSIIFLLLALLGTGSYFLGFGLWILEGAPASAWNLLAYWSLALLLVVGTLDNLFRETLFHLGREQLVLEIRILGIKSRKALSRNSIARLVQKRQSARGVSYSLRIEGEKSVLLPMGKEAEDSRWLGRFLAEWASAELVLAPEED
jgi:hypothetical protein